MALRNEKDVCTLVSETFLITSYGDQAAAEKIACCWRHDRNRNESTFFSTLDLRLSVLPATHVGNFEDATGTPFETLIHGICEKSHGLKLLDTNEIATTVILVPRDRGEYVCRIDILDLRMGQSQFVEQVISFANWDKHLQAAPINIGVTSRLLTLVLSSPGAFQARDA